MGVLIQYSRHVSSTLCGQRKLRSACTFIQFNHSLRCPYVAYKYQFICQRLTALERMQMCKVIYKFALSRQRMEYSNVYSFVCMPFFFINENFISNEKHASAKDFLFLKQNLNGWLQIKGSVINFDWRLVFFAGSNCCQSENAKRLVSARFDSK